MALNPSTGWRWRKKLNISNSSSDYQIKLRLYSGEGTDDPANGIVYCNNHCKNFPNDIRFGTTDNPSTANQLPQWIEEVVPIQPNSLSDANDEVDGTSAFQGVALDDTYFYGINTHFIVLTRRSNYRSLDVAKLWDGSSYTDYTAQANDLTDDNVLLTSSSPSVGECFYFGHFDVKFRGLEFKISTAGSGITLKWEYWNGSTWAELPNVHDGTNNYTNTDWNVYVYWDLPSDWQKTTVDNVQAYYVRTRIVSVSSPSQAKAKFIHCGRYVGNINTGGYGTHHSDGMVKDSYLYVAFCNYPTDTKGGIAKYSVPDLDFIEVVKTFEADSSRGNAASVEYHEIDGVGYWWVIFDNLDITKDSKIFRYDSNWTNKIEYTLTLHDSGGYGYQGFTWWEKDGNHFIFCPTHSANVHIYKWTGSGFEGVKKVSPVNHDNHYGSQGCIREPGTDYIWFASRVNRTDQPSPIIKGEVEYTEEHAIIWVKLPSDGSDTIYMFVGNSSASQYSDGEATFIFFDDFEGTSLDTSKWDKVGDGSVTITDSTVEVDISSYSTSIYSKSQFGTWTAIRCKWRATSTTLDYPGFGYGNKGSPDPDIVDDSYKGHGITIAKIHYYNNYLQGRQTDDGSNRAETGNLGVDQSEFHTYEIRRKSSSSEFVVDDGSPVSLTSHYPTEDLYIGIGGHTRGESGKSIGDWILVRKFADPEPTWSSFGNWEPLEERQWQDIEQGWSSFSNQASWSSLQSGYSTFSNQASWGDLESGWITFSNISSWDTLQSGWSTFSNSSSWSNLQTGWATFGNFSSWSILQSGWIRFSNAASWNNIQQGWARFGNQVSWKNLQSGWILFSNTPAWQSIQTGWARFSNQSAWDTIESGWMKFSNTPTWNTIQSGWAKFSNQANWDNLESGWVTFSSTEAVWHTIEQGWTTFGNESAWSSVQEGWTEFSNQANWNTIESGWVTFSSGERTWQTIEEGWVTFENTTVSWQNVKQGWSSFKNQANWDTLQEGWVKFTASEAVWHTIQEGWITFSNTTVSWHTIKEGWTKFSNHPSWNNLQHGWMTFGNTLAWQTLQEGWSEFSNSCTWDTIEEGYSTFENTASWDTLQSGWVTFTSAERSWRTTEQGWAKFNSTPISWKILQQGWSKFGNIATWSTLQEGWVKFSSGRAWHNLEQGYVTFENQTSWHTIEEGWTEFVGGKAWITLQEGWVKFSGEVKIVITGVFPPSGAEIEGTQPECLFSIEHLDDKKMNYSIYWGVDVNNMTLLTHAENVSSGTYSFTFFPATIFGYTYFWKIVVDDGDVTAEKVCNFTLNKVSAVSVSSTPTYLWLVLIIIALIFMFLAIHWQSTIFAILDVALWFTNALLVNAIPIPYFVVKSGEVVTSTYVLSFPYLSPIFWGLGFIMVIYTAWLLFQIWTERKYGEDIF